MFERGEHVSFSNCCLPYHLSGTVASSDALVLMSPEKFKKQHNIDARTNSEVIDIKRDEKKVVVKNVERGPVTNEGNTTEFIKPKKKYEYYIFNSKSGKWYVNAGHGGFESDDRPTPMPLLSGGEYFYESEGNLDRAFHMQKFLEKNGGTVKMSRTTNTSSSDLNLTSIATYSSSYGGYFISMHSNGANASANYHVALYKGSNSSNHIGGSERMAYWDSYNNYKNGCLTEYTYGTPRSMADYDLMGWHYGVLRTNTQPGYLVETWFHDYRPESLRFKSSLYNKFLAWQIAVARLTAPGGSGALPGCIVGDVRDTSKGCGYSNYTTRGRDSYLALNDVTVTLSGNGLNQSVTTGSKCNGVYAFFVPAGTYTLTFKKTGYKTVTKTVNSLQKKSK